MNAKSVSAGLSFDDTLSNKLGMYQPAWSSVLY